MLRKHRCVYIPLYNRYITFQKTNIDNDVSCWQKIPSTTEQLLFFSRCWSSNNIFISFDMPLINLHFPLATWDKATHRVDTSCYCLFFGEAQTHKMLHMASWRQLRKQSSTSRLLVGVILCTSSMTFWQLQV